MLRNKNIKFNKEKFKTLMHYIIYKCGHKENVGKTVLYKLLYFTDFNYYELHETMITGESYIKWTRGPAPRDFEESKNEFISWQKERSKGYMGFIYKYCYGYWTTYGLWTRKLYL